MADQAAAGALIDTGIDEGTVFTRDRRGHGVGCRADDAAAPGCLPVLDGGRDAKIDAGPPCRTEGPPPDRQAARGCGAPRRSAPSSAPMPECADDVPGRGAEA